VGAPVSLGWLGIGREMIAGSPVAPAATVPVNAQDWGTEDAPQFLEDMGVRAVMASPAGRVMGIQQGRFSYGAPFYLDSGGYWLDNLFGDVSTTCGGTLGTAQALTAALSTGATSLAVGTSLGAVTTGSVIQISDGAASEVVIASASSTGTAVNFASTPCRFPHAVTATAALQTAAASYSHQFAVLNAGTGQPPTHTLTDVTGLTPGVLGRSSASACLTSLTIAGSPAGFITAKYAGASFLSGPAASTPVPGRSFTAALPGWAATLTIGGAPAVIGPWAVTFGRAMAGYWNAQGSLSPAVFARGDLTVTGTLTYVLPADEAPLDAMLTAGQQPIVITASNGLSGASELSLTITSSAAQVTQSRPDRHGSAVAYAAAWGASVNGTDIGGSGGDGPATVTLVNGVPNY
jgi:hypothetical protein